MANDVTKLAYKGSAEGTPVVIPSAHDLDILRYKTKIEWAERELTQLRHDRIVVEYRLRDLEPAVEFDLDETEIQVRLTAAGEKVLSDRFVTPVRLADGYTEFYFTTFIRLFGSHKTLGNECYEGKVRMVARNHDKRHPVDHRTSSELRMLRGNIARGIADMEREIAGAKDCLEYLATLQNEK